MPSSLPKTYKVAVFKEKGSPLTIEERELKQPGDGEVSNVTTYQYYNPGLYVVGRF